MKQQTILCLLLIATTTSFGITKKISTPKQSPSRIITILQKIPLIKWFLDEKRSHDVQTSFALSYGLINISPYCTKAANRDALRLVAAIPPLMLILPERLGRLLMQNFLLKGYYKVIKRIPLVKKGFSRLCPDSNCASVCNRCQLSKTFVAIILPVLFLNKLAIPALTRSIKQLQKLLEKRTEFSKQAVKPPALTQECPICQEEYQDKTPLQLNPCKHWFCKECVKLYFFHYKDYCNRDNKTCPVCRTPTDIEALMQNSQLFA